MVYTHSRRACCLILAAFAPTLPWRLALLLVRAALSQMDVPARSSYVMAVVTPPERAGRGQLHRRCRAASHRRSSPLIAGALFAAGFTAWPLVICGTLKIVYDLAAAGPVPARQAAGRTVDVSQRGTRYGVAVGWPMKSRYRTSCKRASKDKWS